MYIVDEQVDKAYRQNWPGDASRELSSIVLKRSMDENSKIIFADDSNVRDGRMLYCGIGVSSVHIDDFITRRYPTGLMKDNLLYEVVGAVGDSTKELAKQLTEVYPHERSDISAIVLCNLYRGHLDKLHRHLRRMVPRYAKDIRSKIILSRAEIVKKDGKKQRPDHLQSRDYLYKQEVGDLVKDALAVLYGVDIRTEKELI